MVYVLGRDLRPRHFPKWILKISRQTNLRRIRVYFVNIVVRSNDKCVNKSRSVKKLFKKRIILNHNFTLQFYIWCVGNERGEHERKEPFRDFVRFVWIVNHPRRTREDQRILRWFPTGIPRVEWQKFVTLLIDRAATNFQNEVEASRKIFYLKEIYP